MTYASALAALADPTRRQVFERLPARPPAGGEPANAPPAGPPAVGRARRRAPGGPPRGRETLKGVEGGGLCGRPSRGHPPRLLHRSSRPGRTSQVAGPIVDPGARRIRSRARRRGNTYEYAHKGTRE